MAGLEHSVAGLLAREAIRDLPHRYCDCVWRGDGAGIAALFASDGVFTAVAAQGTRSVRGRTALAEFFNAALEIAPRPFIHNHVVDMLADGLASGRCYLDLRSAARDMDWIGAGYYEDQYIATREGWKFQSRVFHALRMEQWPRALEPSGDR